MTVSPRDALTALQINLLPGADDVWKSPGYHVDGLHAEAIRDLDDGIAWAAGSADTSPQGLILQGQRGSGKTHLLGALRHRTHDAGGYFFLIDVIESQGFWDNIRLSLVEGLSRTVRDGESQLRLMLRRLTSTIGAPADVRSAVTSTGPVSKELLDEFISSLEAYDSYLSRECRDTARALALYGSADLDGQDVARSFLTSADEVIPGERAAWGIRGSRPVELIIRDISRLLAITGPSVIAIDQIDTALHHSDLTSKKRPDALSKEQIAALEYVGGGLMSLRESTRRTFVVVCCIPATWRIIETYAADTVQDRFRKTAVLTGIRDGSLARAIVEKRLAFHYSKVGFRPPHPTWPFKESAFEQASEFTPRQLLTDVAKHVHDCLISGAIRELDDVVTGQTSEGEDFSDLGDLELLDDQFAQLREQAAIALAADASNEDTEWPSLLTAGLTAWIIERDASNTHTVDPEPGEQRPALHARMRSPLTEDTENELEWSFRAISREHHHIAALHRIRDAKTAARVSPSATTKKLFLLRKGEWSPGRVTQQELRELEAGGSAALELSDNDLRTLYSLRTLLKKPPAELIPWLVSRKPAHGIQFFQLSLPSDGEPKTVIKPLPNRIGLHIGRSANDRSPVIIDLESMRKHVAIFAGSGSGKTVLIRRIVEEAALQGVSSIVLDPNNDLARLGDAWPSSPSEWSAEDAEKAAEYRSTVEVCVWTPRRAVGRPLSLQPLPDFRSVLDDPDEFAAAVESAVASLVPRAILQGGAHKMHLAQAVLRRAVEHYGRLGGTTVKGLIGLLASLPQGVSEIDGSEKIGADLAKTLTATMVNDPMFGGDGTPVDPAILFQPTEGKRARISVISFVGLPDDKQRQSFVNQLQMALFSWIKENPAGHRPLGGLLVMDEAQNFAPSEAMTACTQSTLALVSQARKYGLGLIFATQAPKGLHNRIPGNAATQFFGLLNSPIQIEAARSMAQAKGGDVPGISALSAGTFYVASEGTSFEKTEIAMCLSHHPPSPLTTEEVIERAAGTHLSH